jgi:hypothetical protein
MIGFAPGIAPIASLNRGVNDAILRLFVVKPVLSAVSMAKIGY